MVGNHVLEEEGVESRLPTVGEVIAYLRQFSSNMPAALDDDGAGDLDDVAILSNFFDAFSDHG